MASMQAQAAHCARHAPQRLPSRLPPPAGLQLQLPSLVWDDAKVAEPTGGLDDLPDGGRLTGMQPSLGRSKRTVTLEVCPLPLPAGIPITAALPGPRPGANSCLLRPGASWPLPRGLLPVPAQTACACVGVGMQDARTTIQKWAMEELRACHADVSLVAVHKRLLEEAVRGSLPAKADQSWHRLLLAKARTG